MRRRRRRGSYVVIVGIDVLENLAVLETPVTCRFGNRTRMGVGVDEILFARRMSGAIAGESGHDGRRVIIIIIIVVVDRMILLVLVFEFLRWARWFIGIRSFQRQWVFSQCRCRRLLLRFVRSHGEIPARHDEN